MLNPEGIQVGKIVYLYHLDAYSFSWPAGNGRRHRFSSAKLHKNRTVSASQLLQLDASTVQNFEHMFFCFILKQMDILIQ